MVKVLEPCETCDDGKGLWKPLEGGTDKYWYGKREGKVCNISFIKGMCSGGQVLEKESLQTRMNVLRVPEQVKMEMLLP